MASTELLLIFVIESKKTASAPQQTDNTNTPGIATQETVETETEMTTVAGHHRVRLLPGAGDRHTETAIRLGTTVAAGATAAVAVAALDGVADRIMARKAEKS